MVWKHCSQTIKRLESGCNVNIKKYKRIVYEALVDNNALISQAFSEYLQSLNTEGLYLKKLLKIIELNWKFRVCRKKSLDEDIKRLSFPEYKTEKRLSVDEIISRVEGADIVSFDVFDTLILRYVEKPTDVFKIIESENHIFEFAKNREAAEKIAHEQKKEVSIYDIYDVLEKQIGINKTIEIERECKIEEMLCYANPYMKQLYDELCKKNKVMIAVSDMYLPEAVIRRILDKCGYSRMSKIYVSCDIQLAKHNGELQRHVHKIVGEEKKVVHIGDNLEADVNQSKKNGWDTIYYKNINEIGRPYRRREMKSIAASFYKALVNAKMHAGNFIDSPYYEYGYVYGGLLAVGYCQYLKKLREEKNIDQFIFVARDGYVMHKIYQQYDSEMNIAYVPFSRFASYQINMEQNLQNFFKRVVVARIQATPPESIAEVLRICDIEYVEPYLEQYGMKKTDIFNHDAYQKMKAMFEDNLSGFIKYYAETEKAAERFYKEIIGDNKNVCIVDIGWRGTGATALKYFLEEKCKMKIHVCGALLATSDRDATDICISNGNLYSYLFSRQHNSELLKRHMAKHTENEYRNLLMEILFTEDNPSFLKYKLNENEDVEFEYGLKENNTDIILQVQEGMLDFSREYFSLQKIFGVILDVSGYEAYLPFDALLQNKRYCVELMGNYEITEDTGVFSELKRRTFKDVLYN